MNRRDFEFILGWNPRSLLPLVDGRPLSAICHSRRVDRHPDTGAALDAIEIPDFDELLRIATVAGSHTRLGYVGVDLVLDAVRGPVILELNARPGLAMQLANSSGLILRLRAIDERARGNALVDERIQLSRDAEIRCTLCPL
jgi:hypothetical protein